MGSRASQAGFSSQDSDYISYRMLGYIGTSALIRGVNSGTELEENLSVWTGGL